MVSTSFSRTFLPWLLACKLFADPVEAYYSNELHVTNFPQSCARNKPYIFTDLLYWRAEEGATSWADVIHIQPKPFFNQADLAFGWDFGFRAGIGYHFDYDHWDLKFAYTRFCTKANNSYILDPEDIGIILSEFLGSFIELPRTIFGTTSIEWKILFNMFDWELGRDFLVSRALSLRPFIGLKGGWIHQTILTHWTNPLSLVAEENLKNNFWGIGPSGGVNTDWRFGENQLGFFSLFGDFSTAYMWGKWTGSDVYSDNSSAKVFINTPSTFLGSLTFRCFSGISWTTDFNKSRFAVRIGYEMQFWFNQLKIVTFNELRAHHDLTLQGVTCDIRFDF